MKTGTDLLAGHREGQTDRREELLTGNVAGGLRLVLCLYLGLDSLIIAQRDRGDGRIFAGHRERHADRGEELLAAEVLGLLARPSLGYNAANGERFAAGIAIAQRGRGDGRILIIHFRLDRGSLRRLDLLGGGFASNDALLGGGFASNDALLGGGFASNDALLGGASLTLRGGPVNAPILVTLGAVRRGGAASNHRDVLT